MVERWWCGVEERGRWSVVPWRPLVTTYVSVVCDSGQWYSDDISWWYVMLVWPLWAFLYDRLLAKYGCVSNYSCIASEMSSRDFHVFLGSLWCWRFLMRYRASQLPNSLFDVVVFLLFQDFLMRVHTFWAATRFPYEMSCFWARMRLPYASSCSLLHNLLVRLPLCLQVSQKRIFLRMTWRDVNMLL